MSHEDETPRELDQAAHGADVHDEGDTAPADAPDAIESDRDAELARDAEDFARTAAAPRIVGYTGGYVDQATNRFFISKIYLLKEHRGQGFSSATIRFYEMIARKRGLDALYLTVNKNNEMAIRAYKANGFEVIDAVETDIGEGFVMDDYIMERKVR
ncbi:MAG: GNAT family N-acetyltransferase [Eggerthellaceae bacterium]|nr:GNAT family N-acetyltransferase [Eggerthellaceae bacterium]